jgi:hypothetical protein
MTAIQYDRAKSAPANHPSVCSEQAGVCSAAKSNRSRPDKLSPRDIANYVRITGRWRFYLLQKLVVLVKSLLDRVIFGGCSLERRYRSVGHFASMIHASDCSVNNAPALPVGPCDCGLNLALDAALHSGVSPLVAWARRHGFLVDDQCREYLVETHQLPPDGLIMDAATSDLPDAHNPVALFGPSNGVDFDDSGIPVVTEF